MYSSVCLLLVLLCYNSYCDDCVTYNFEENGKDNFTNVYGICSGMATWDIGKYSLLAVEPPHEQSFTFIRPTTSLSCISSFKFTIIGSGTVEVNIFMNSTFNSDQVTVLVFQSLEGRPDATIGNVVLSPHDVNFVPGWHTVRVTIIGTGGHECYITFLGMASANSVILVDSFRYIAPTFDEDLCIIYKNDEASTNLPTAITTPGTQTPTITTPGTQTPTKTTPGTQTPTITTPGTQTPTITTPGTQTPTITTPGTQTPTKTTPGIQTPTITTPGTQTPITTITTPITTTSTVTSVPTGTTKSSIPTTTSVAPTIVTTTTSTTPADRPRLSVSILLIKINKFFR